MNKILIVIGSKSDKEKATKHIQILEELGLEYSLEIASAHRNPKRVEELSSTAHEKGYSIIIAGAGLAAALPGAVAAHTFLPVIGVPISAGSLNGMDSLYSIVQMPSGVPVGSMGIDNFKNAFIYAAQILGVHNATILEKLKKFKTKLSEN